MQNPWDQQPDETSKAFERFALYRDMGAGRSLRKLAKDLELNPSTLAEISKREKWQERVQAFDAYIDKASQLSRLTFAEITSITSKLAKSTRIEREPGRWPILEPEVDLAGQYDLTLKWLSFALEVNYGDFLGEGALLSGAIKRAAASPV